jgi:hypothetical protein
VTPEEYQAHVRKVVDAAPPLNDEARELLLRLGCPIRSHTAGEGVVVQRACGTERSAATPDPADRRAS